eukprot:TRINITY_DN19404_c0_g2_i1.p1 TRINITY_DN19404_c0_g2~~TRINITY_DN19404_c0_g2_i1.p1  ORF type:complete len:286 (+),score=40.27 TRINITY_DN19404_c0_g2_i1:109-966(+)
MRTIDLSHPIHTGMPVYPGDFSPDVRRTRFIRRDKFAEMQLTITSHTGTHVDTAGHLFEDAPGLDGLGPDNFTGWGAVADLANRPKPIIEQADLAFLSDTEVPDFVLIRTGWDRHWQTGRYYQDYPILSETAARYLGGLELKGLGLDTPSPDVVDTLELPAHRILFDHGMVIVENLTNLGELPPKDFLFCCLPLKIKDGEASPVRAVGITFQDGPPSSRTIAEGAQAILQAEPEGAFLKSFPHRPNSTAKRSACLRSSGELTLKKEIRSGSPCLRQETGTSLTFT